MANHSHELCRPQASPVEASAYLDQVPVEKSLLTTWLEARSDALATLVAIKRVLDADFSHLLIASSFIPAYEAARGLPVESLHGSLGSPGGLLWLRAMRDVLEIEAGAPATKFIMSIVEAIGSDFSPRKLLDELGVFVAAAALHCGRDITFTRPIPVRRNVSLPATGLTLRPCSPAAGMLAVREGRVITRDVEIGHSQVLQFGQFCAVVDVEDALLISNLFEPLAKVTSPEQVVQFADGLRDAIALVRDVMPGMWHEIAAACRVAIPIRPKVDNTYPSGTTSSALGLTYLCFGAPPHITAEMLVHEVSHGHLFLLQSQNPLLDPAIHGDGWRKPFVYSPWRDDARPINGLVHACFVFGRVARFWESIVHNCRDLNLIDFAERRLSTLAVQLRWGVGILEQSAKWTAAGEHFLYAIKRLVGSLQVHQTGIERPLYLSAQHPGVEHGNAEVRQEWHYHQWLSTKEARS